MTSVLSVASLTSLISLLSPPLSPSPSFSPSCTVIFSTSPVTAVTCDGGASEPHRRTPGFCSYTSKPLWVNNTTQDAKSVSLTIIIAMTVTDDTAEDSDKCIKTLETSNYQKLYYGYNKEEEKQEG